MGAVVSFQRNQAAAIISNQSRSTNITEKDLGRKQGEREEKNQKKRKYGW